MFSIRYKTTVGKAEFEFLIEREADGSYRPYLIRFWGDVDFKIKLKVTTLVQDGHNRYVTMIPAPHSVQEAKLAAILWVEELEQASSARYSKKDNHSLASSAGSMLQHMGPTDAQKAAAEWQRKQRMANGQVSMPPDWHPPTHRETGLPIGDIMMHGGQHTTPGHPRVLGPGGQPFAPPFQPGPGHGGRH